MRFKLLLWQFSVLVFFFSCKKEAASISSDSNSSSNTPINSAHSIEFTFKPGSTGFYYNSPIIKGNYLYVGTSTKYFSDVATDNAFYKLDLSLTKIWQYNLDTLEVRGAAALDSDDNIYFTVQEGRKNGNMSNSKIYVYSLDNQGIFRWKKLIASNTEVREVGCYELAIGAHVYVHGNALYALEKSNGSEAWKVTGSDGISKPIIDGSGNIYLVHFNGLDAYDASGNKKWGYVPADNFTENGDAFNNAAFSASDQSKIVFCYDTWIYNINAADGTLIWKYNAPHSGYQRTTPTVDDQGNIYIGRKNHNAASSFYCIKHDGSGLLWENNTFGEIYNTAALANDSNIYFGSEMLNNGPNVTPGFNRIHAININSGKVVWEADLGSDVANSSPAIGPNGKIYVGNMGYTGEAAKLVCIKTTATGTLGNAVNAQFGD